MTDYPVHFSAQTRYEIELLERLQQFDLTDEALAENVGLPLDKLVRSDDYEPPEYDTERVCMIAHYLIDEEELGDDFDTDDEHEHILNIGMFIYGFMQWGEGLGSEADHG